MKKGLCGLAFVLAAAYSVHADTIAPAPAPAPAPAASPATDAAFEALKSQLQAVSAPPAFSWKTYFHEGFDTVYIGQFYSLAGSPTPTRTGAMMPIIEHRAKDGYFLIPGVNWNLLNFGGSSPTASLDKIRLTDCALEFGPSIDFGGPLDNLLLAGVERLPQSGPDSYAALKVYLKDDSNVRLAMGLNERAAYKKNAAGKGIIAGGLDIWVAAKIAWGGGPKK